MNNEHILLMMLTDLHNLTCYFTIYVPHQLLDTLAIVYCWINL